MGMRITSLPVFANLHYNSGVGTFLLRIQLREGSRAARRGGGETVHGRTLSGHYC